MSQLRFRNLIDEQDYPILLEVNESSRHADQIGGRPTLENIAEGLKHLDGVTPQEGVLIAFMDDQPIGYSRLGWYSSGPDVRLYYQFSWLREDYRDKDFWPLMVAINEQRLHKIADRHKPVANRYYQAWSTDKEKDWIKVLEVCKYQVVRRFNNMTYKLGNPPVAALPAGFEIRPATAEHMPLIWQTLKEFNAGLFENVAEDWLDDKYPEWLQRSENAAHNWHVAWTGEHLAGLMCAHFDAEENEKLQRKHGYTEHIYVKPAWRGKGLASALISRSLQVLKEQGITEAELGVDSENESAAFRLYEKLGYKTFSVDTWFRKPLE